MNKTEFVDAVAARLSEDRKAAAAAVDAFIGTVYAGVADGDRVSITGFGVFERRERAARTARNPATGASVEVQETSVPGFRPGAQFRAVVKGSPSAAAAEASAARKSVRAASAADKVDAVKKEVADKTDAVKKGAAKKNDAVKKDVAAKKQSAKKDADKKKAAKKSGKK